MLSLAMLRSLFTLALSLFLLAEASAQTTPAASAKKAAAKSTKASARATRRATKKAQRVGAKPAPVAPVAADDWMNEWPAVDETQTTVASAAAASAEAYPRATESRGEIDNANVYAAPGKPVHVPTSTKMAPYSVRPPRKAASTQTTLGTGN